MTNTKQTIPEPLPRIANFEKLGFGLFLHWGLYSQLGAGEWVLFHAKNPTEYNKLQQSFTAVDFNARNWARLAKAAGMRYITLTTRHHDGFSLYETCGLSKFDAPNSAAKRDLVAEFVEACRAEEIIPFFYHTTIDFQWGKATPDLPADGGPNFSEYLDYFHAGVELLAKITAPLAGSGSMEIGDIPRRIGRKTGSTV